MTAHRNGESAAVRCMRLTFWGVQGSSPIFPSPCGVQEYSRRVAVHTLMQAVEDMRRRAGGRHDLEAILGGPPTPQAIEAWQQRLGLPEMPFYGGETTCIQVETSEGDVLVFDAGSGIRRCSQHIVRTWGDRAHRTVHLFGTHEHLDHRIGFVYARFLYDADPFEVRIYGPYRFLDAIDQRYGVLSRQIGPVTHVDDPVDYRIMSARVAGLEIAAGADSLTPAGPATARHWPVHQLDRPIRIGSTTVTPFDVYHASARCLGYKVEHAGRSFILCTDHELRHGDDGDAVAQRRSGEAEQRIRSLARNADLLYIDGQFFLEEYLGKKGIGASPALRRVDWGHGCIEDVIERSRECNIALTLVGHHDPERTWPMRVEMDEYLRRISDNTSNRIRLADGDMVIDL